MRPIETVGWAERSEAQQAAADTLPVASRPPVRNPVTWHGNALVLGFAALSTNLPVRRLKAGLYVSPGGDCKFIAIQCRRLSICGIHKLCPIT
ncbi:MAG: hypothetical protein BMS9Abin08_0324 [Gammaproteobacteria bacterium]|nr:MAG: hypothetical protein BMS9Abin08_0324 [Gammaproteobacteria bacterium]